MALFVTRYNYLGSPIQRMYSTEKYDSSAEIGNNSSPYIVDPLTMKQMWRINQEYGYMVVNNRRNQSMIFWRLFWVGGNILLWWL